MDIAETLVVGWCSSLVSTSPLIREANLTLHVVPMSRKESNRVYVVMINDRFQIANSKDQRPRRIDD
ncbi:hypothetical protein L484_025642 [Morus notabilis]|uniref:Uncharacterized protein n=1 Tax=Morus notabilis TaxID=981085 RepID=W9RJE9_9ROSA|nr:hypothetical protein L484_025642 [Morus notabilis]